MSPTLDLSEFVDLPVPLEVLRQLDERAQRQGLRILVIGAAARDLVVHAPTTGRSRRATLDVDVAVAVNRPQFEAFTSGLQSVRGSEHKFLVSGIEVDVLPFGPIERGRNVELNDGHELDVNGVAEAARTAVQVLLPDGSRLQVASLPAQAALKVLAWRDRHHVNSKDGQDLGEILDASALGPYAEETWTDTQALERSDYDIYRASAFRVGRLASEPFSPWDGQHILNVVENRALAARLVGHMGASLSREQLTAFGEGFRAGLGLNKADDAG